MIKRFTGLAGVPVLIMVLAISDPAQAEAQQHYESTSESYSIGNGNFGAGLDLFAEFQHTQTKVRAFGSAEGYATFFGQNINLLDAQILSQVNNGTSTNKAYLKVFGNTLVNQNNPVQWQWTQNSVTPIGNPMTYSFPLFWGLSVELGCEMEAGMYANMKIGVASLVGAGLDGSVGPKVQVDIYAALSASLLIVKAQVALQANFTLFDYSLNVDATISPYGANVVVFTDFKPLTITVKLVLRYKTWSPGPWYAPWNGSWSGWKVKKSWTLWSWSLAQVTHEILNWSVVWWVPTIDLNVDHRFEASSEKAGKSFKGKKRMPRRGGRRRR